MKFGVAFSLARMKFGVAFSFDASARRLPETMADEPFDIEPLDATFGAVVTGVELRSIDDAAFEALHKTWLEFALLIFPGQFLTKKEQDAFALRFGPLEFKAAAFSNSNVDADGNILTDPDHDVVKSLRGNEGWHHDSTYMPLQAKGSVFTAEVVTSRGGATGWADMRAAYEALDADTRQRLAGMRAHHSLYYSQGRSGYMPTKTEGGGYDMYGFHDLDPSLRPLVKVHPKTGRPNLLIGRHAYGIVGMTEDESEAFLGGLNAEALPAAVPSPSSVGCGRRGPVGQPPPDASGHPVRHDRAPGHVAHPHSRRSGLGAGRQPPELPAAIGHRCDGRGHPHRRLAGRRAK